MPREKPRRKPHEEVRGRVRAHDPFDLIRWLALSQPDPRKALSELVQNSLDATARKIRISRVRVRGVTYLHIHDDGEGVIPEMDRPEALRYIATHIGHSRKRALSPSERMELMTQGQYGIGLLGFWSLGQTLEMRSSVAGQKAHRLVLHRDRPDFVISPLRGRLPLEETWTEVVIAGLHREATSALIARRAADYLAAELRGQLLARDAEVVVEDRISRGTAPKRIAVRPPKFLGERIPMPDLLPVEGQPSIRVEIYFTGEAGEGGAAPGIGIYSSGTLVAETFHELASLGLDRSPWTDRRLTGLVDFPALHVAPGSRRGVIIDDAAGAFARALSKVEDALTALLDRVEMQRVQQLDRTLMRDLQKAFRDFYRQRPRYAMLPIQDEKDQAAGLAPSEGENGLPAPGVDAAANGDADAEPITEPPIVPVAGEEGRDLFPPGPLASVRIIPGRLRVARESTRRVRAEALDRTGRAIADAVEFVWALECAVGSLDAQTGPEITFSAGSELGEGLLTVTARSHAVEAIAEAPVEVVEDVSAGRAHEGIPEPEFVNQPGALWRSRMEGPRWQVNSGHGDFRAVAERPVLKLRYLALLFAKEIVLRSHQDPRLDEPLEQLAEIASYADIRLSARGRRSRGGKESGDA